MKKFIIEEAALADVIRFLMTELPMVKTENVVNFLRQLPQLEAPKPELVKPE